MKTLYDHGQVYTGQLPLASAFVVEGDRFLAVGNREDLEKFASLYPHLSIIVAHPRDGADYQENLARMRRHENVCLDLSGTGLFRYGMLRHGLDQVGKDRILFGTDYPICNPGMYVEAVLFENLTDEELEAVMEKNARRLIFKEE